MMDKHLKKKGLKLDFVASMALYYKHRLTLYFSTIMYSLPMCTRLMSTFQHLLYITYADNGGVPVSFGWGCILRTKKQIYYLGEQVLSGNVTSHWGFQGDYLTFECI